MKFTLRLLLTAAIGLSCVWAQKSGGTGGGTGTSTGGTAGSGGSAGTGGTTGGTTGGATGTTNPGTGTGPQTIAPSTPQAPVAPLPRPIILMGTVVADDGSPLPANINIQTICSSQQRTVAHAASTGDFEFQWADKNSGVFSDASDNGRMGGFGSGSGGATSSATGGRTVDPMADCDLRAEASGYSSSRVSLFNHSQFDRFDVGTIVLHRITGDEGTTVSALSLRAPKAAKKSFDKGTEQEKARKLNDAAASFQKAVDDYPQYADAWFSLGKVESDLGSRDAARTDFQKAMDLDNKLVGPWQQLGFLASDQGKWDDAVRYLDQAVRLDPMNSPMAWYFNAMANYNLGRFDAAERSVRAEMKLDHGSNPLSQYLLGMTLIARKDLPGAADALRTYIASAPNAKETPTARVQLSRIENQLNK